MQHIATETGANITLRGKGSGIQEGDALHIYISSAIPKAFAEAAKLAQNLLDTVKSEHDKQACHPLPPRRSFLDCLSHSVRYFMLMRLLVYIVLPFPRPSTAFSSSVGTLKLAMGVPSRRRQ